MQAHLQGCEHHSNSELRRGPWTSEEDLILTNYIAVHGEGRWNSLACSAGLKRTGKSCRLRWLNYLRPDVRRGNLTAEEQLLILELHSRWGNRWSKIAKYLPGRTDNEIKNYWRTRVQKHARYFQCDVNSKKFKDLMRYLWMPRLVERIHATSTYASTSTSTSATSFTINDSVGMVGRIGCEDISMLPPSYEGMNSRNCTNSDGLLISDSIPTEFFSPSETIKVIHEIDEWIVGENVVDSNRSENTTVQSDRFESFNEDFAGLDQDLSGILPADNFWNMMDGELWSTLQEFDSQSHGCPIGC